MDINIEKLKSFLNAHPNIFKNYVRWCKDENKEEFTSELSEKRFKKFLKERGYLVGGKICNQNILRVIRLNRLQTLFKFKENLITHHTDYQNIKFDDDSVIYCDPPYKGTKGYDGEDVTRFDSAKFWMWAEKVGEKHPIFISEIVAPEPFVCIWEKKKRNLMNSEVRKKGHENFERTERLFTLPKWIHLARLERSLFDD